MKTIYAVAVVGGLSVCVVFLPAASYMPLQLYIYMGKLCMVNYQKIALL